MLAADADGAGADALQPAGRIDPKLRVVGVRTMDLGDESAVREQNLGGPVPRNLWALSQTGHFRCAVAKFR